MFKNVVPNQYLRSSSKRLTVTKSCAPDTSAATPSMAANTQSSATDTIGSTTSNFKNTASALKTQTSYENFPHSNEMEIVSNETNEVCPICLDKITNDKRLDKCGHVFCADCIEHYFSAVKPQCPCCFTIYGEIRGNQPDNGKMTIRMDGRRLPGFKHNSEGTIVINYEFPSGIQDERHPNPGQPYYGTSRVAYLPQNEEGRKVLKLLEMAFELRQTFTVGQSRTTGCENVVTWNDIHHKTSVHGGPNNFGYPDDTYLNRVRQELAAKGIQ